MASTINASNASSGGIITTADASGVLDLQAANTTVASISSSGVAVTGTMSVSSNMSVSGTFTPTTMGGSVLTRATAQASTSGTSIDFTGIPSWVKRITVMFSGVSTNGSSVIQIQLGSGSPTTSGYLGQVWQANTGNSALSAGFAIATNSTASISNHGSLIFTNISSNTWTGFGTVGRTSDNSIASFGGSIALSGVLDRVRITTVNGTDTFDAGSINIMYE